MQPRGWGQLLPQVIFWRCLDISRELPCLCFLPSWLSPPLWLWKDVSQPEVPWFRSAPCELCDTASSAGTGALCFPTIGRTPLRGRQKTFWLQKGFSPAKPFCCLNSTPHPAVSEPLLLPSSLNRAACTSQLERMLGESLWNWGVKLGDAAVSSSCVGASCLSGPSPVSSGALPHAAILENQEDLS